MAFINILKEMCNTTINFRSFSSFLKGTTCQEESLPISPNPTDSAIDLYRSAYVAYSTFHTNGITGFFVTDFFHWAQCFQSSSPLSHV